jgi:hypothetical protein
MPPASSRDPSISLYKNAGAIRRQGSGDGADYLNTPGDSA